MLVDSLEDCVLKDRGHVPFLLWLQMVPSFAGKRSEAWNSKGISREQGSRCVLRSRLAPWPQFVLNYTSVI